MQLILVRPMWVLCACLVAATVPAQAADAPADARVALIIGNGAYKNSPLTNPVNDARAMGRSLKELGFEVMLHENLSQQGFMNALREFGNRLRETHGVGLFYYAGHGMQIKGSNYLIPVDTAIEAEDEVRYLSIDANQVLDKMEQAGNRLNIVILDACRDNPFARRFRSKQTGLAQMDAPSGMLIAFATAPGAVAFDGDGTNGVYTKHLLRNLAVPGLPVELVLKRVREGVSKETGQKQIPWESSSLLGDFYFKTDTSRAAPTLQPDAASLELAFWESIKNSKVADEYRAYLEQYPDGKFAPLARARVNTLLAQAPATAKKPASASDSPTQLALAQPSSAAAPRPPALAKVGDNWTYELVEGGKRKGDTITMKVAAIEGDRLQETMTRASVRGFGATRTFKPGFDPEAGIQETELPGSFFLLEFSPYITAEGAPPLGKEWKNVAVDLTLKGSGSLRVRTAMNVRVIGEERVRVPAGEFRTVRVEAQSRAYFEARKDGSEPSVVLTYWYSPEVRRAVKVSSRTFAPSGRPDPENILELAGYQQSR